MQCTTYMLSGGGVRACAWPVSWGFSGRPHLLPLHVLTHEVPGDHLLLDLLSDRLHQWAHSPWPHESYKMTMLSIATITAKNKQMFSVYHIYLFLPIRLDLVKGKPTLNITTNLSQLFQMASRRNIKSYIWAFNIQCNMGSKLEHLTQIFFPSTFFHRNYWNFLRW